MPVSHQKQGWLLKWTNYMKGFQRRYVVLSGGVLSYYRSKEEMAHTCRGTLVLSNCSIDIDGDKSFIVYAGDKRSGQAFHLRADTEKGRQEWVTAIELAKHDKSQPRPRAESSRDVASTISVDLEDSQSDDDPDDDGEHDGLPCDIKELTSTKTLSRRFTSVQEKQTKTLELLKRLRDEVHSLSNPPSSLSAAVDHMQNVTSELLTEVGEYLNDVTHHQRKWQRALVVSEEKRKQLEESLESLARQHSRLERDASRAARHGYVLDAASGEGSDEEFFDAEADDEDLMPDFHDAEEELLRPEEATIVVETKPAKKEVVPFTRRVSIPPKPNSKISLWSIMKSAIGKDLSKIPMPVNFNEPISFCQRLSEDLEYYHLLDTASTMSPVDRLKYVAAFTVSSFASSAQRTGKPFNPLLGETFELDRSHDLGYKCIVEQVSHHPPICALHSESEKWVFWQEFSMNSKFRGKYLEVVPTGISHLVFKDNNDHFTWTKTPTTVHNIIVGKLWLDQHGSMTITNHRTGETCELKYIPYSYFARGDARRVVGTVLDKAGQARWELGGTWDKCFQAWAPGQEESKETIWQRSPNVVNYDQMYGLTLMAIQLNEFTPIEDNCAITDSRYRPDKNLMEKGDYDMANRVKHLLEEAQRHRRRQYEATQTKWQPAWFEPKPDPINPTRIVHQYKGGYWEAKASSSFQSMQLVDIFNMSPVKDKDVPAFQVGNDAKTVNKKALPAPVGAKSSSA